jgi:hypothetical protein
LKTEPFIAQTESFFYLAAVYTCPGFSSTKFSGPSSFFTILKTSQDMQETDFCAKSPPQKVPASAQQILPPFLPPFTPSLDESAAAGHTPISAVLLPPGSLPHCLISQQFFLGIPYPSFHYSITAGNPDGFRPPVL